MTADGRRWALPRQLERLHARPDVVFDSDAFTLQQFGGVSRYFVELNRALQASGIDSRIVAPLHQNLHLAGEEQHAGVMLKSMGPGAHRAARWLSLAAQTCLAPRVLHKTWYSARRPLLRSAPVVVTVHDLIHEKFPEHFEPSDKTAALKAQCIRDADHIMAVSENTARDLVAIHGVSRGRITVTHLATSFGTAPASARPHDWPERWVLYVGHRWRYKNFENAARAYAKAGPGEVALLAFGPPPSSIDRELVESLGIADRCHWVSGDDTLLACAYRDAEVLIYPSYYEGFGIPPLEAMACGCPVVSSNRASLPEVVGDAGVLLDPDDIDAMAAALARICGDQPYAATLRASGLARAQNFSWERTAGQTAAGYAACGVTLSNAPVAG